MSIAAPADLEPSRKTRDGARVVCLLGDNDGSRPTFAHWDKSLVIKSIRRSAGGERLDALTFDLDMSRFQRLEDVIAGVGGKQIAEVRRIDFDEQGNLLAKTLGWGVVALDRDVLDGGGEKISLVARMEAYLFGDPLTSFYNHDPILEIAIDVDDHIEFNPSIDGTPSANRSEFQRANDDYVFVDPESLRTDAAQALQDTEAAFWSAAHAAHMLCWLLNPDETYVTNPTLEYCEQTLVGSDNLLRDVKIPLGTLLPQALDMVLKPGGFSWYVEHFLDPGEDPEEEPTPRSELRFFKRGAGVNRNVFCQRIGESINNLDTNIAGYQAEYSFVDLANDVQACSDLILGEGTFELALGWAPGYDTVDLTRLNGVDYPKEVGRKFVLNEAGDYIGLRPEITEHYDLADLIGVHRIKRRKFLPRQTTDDDGAPLPVTVEWFNPDAQPDDEEADPGVWQPVKWSYSVGERECAIYFESQTPPDTLWNLLQEGGETAVKVRVKASIQGDKRTWGHATKRTQSPNGSVVPLILDTSRKFPWRIGGDQESPNDNNDPTEEIQEFAEKIRDISDHLQLSASIMLDGVDHDDYELGHLIDRVHGRNISFRCNRTDPADADEEPRRPQIMGITYHFDNEQRTELLLETFNEEKPT